MPRSMCLPVPMRNDQRQRTAQCLFLAVAEHHFGAPVPADDIALAVGGGNGIVGGLGNGVIPRGTFAQDALDLLALVDLGHQFAIAGIERSGTFAHAPVEFVDRLLQERFLAVDDALGTRHQKV
jgi:hypothetical protein